MSKRLLNFAVKMVSKRNFGNWATPQSGVGVSPLRTKDESLLNNVKVCVCITFSL